MLPALDDFNRADSGPGANWTNALGSFTIVSNTIQGNTVDQNLMFWNADAFANDQKSQVTVPNPGSTGPAVRVSAGGGNGYLIAASTGGSELYKVVAGTFTLLQNLSTTITAGDILRIEAEGTMIRCYKNGAQVGTDQTDSAVASGSAGIYTFSNSAAAQDDFAGDNLVGGGGGGAIGGFRALLGVGR